MPCGTLNLVFEWLDQHRTELLENWKRIEERKLNGYVRVPFCFDSQYEPKEIKVRKIEKLVSKLKFDFCINTEENGINDVLIFLKNKIQLIIKK